MTPLTTGNLQNWLTQRAAELRQESQRWARAESTWVWARLGTFLLAIIVWYPLREHPGLATATVGVAFVLFGHAVKRHREASARRGFVAAQSVVIKEALERVGGKVVVVRSTTRPEGAKPVTRDIVPTGLTWPLAEQERDDLDLYATPNGLFGLLNRTSTGLGVLRLRDAVENICLDPAKLAARQQAVRWLAEHYGARTSLLARLAVMRGADASMQTFEEALVSEAPMLSTFMSWLARAWTAMCIVATMFSLLHIIRGDYLWIWLIFVLVGINWTMLGRMRPRLAHDLRLWEASEEFVAAFDPLTQQGASELPKDTGELSALRDIFDRIARSRALPHALGWIGWAGGGGFIRLIAGHLAFYDLHMLEGILRHTLPHRDALLDGLAAVGELEMLLSLACFASEESKVCWPEPIAQMTLEMTGGWHPLLSPQRAVANDLRLDPQHNVWVITGSNMSGKSTFLRTIGVNVLLAQIGCVATATKMQFTPMRLLTDLRIRDNLGKAESYFLAEVRQLRRMSLPPKGERPVLGLIDEPFRGTNHQEQRAATLAIIEHLKSSRGLFLIATHDRGVAHRSQGMQIDNYHFREELGTRELVFDYKLHEGVAQTRNALRVLEREGYPQPLTDRAHEWADGKQAMPQEDETSKS
jgi:hypothetical protein